jgi:uncharacterized membrane protein YsdA (DUF1294 family)
MAVSSLFLPVVAYAGLNILVCAVFTHDKFMAKMKRGRISEKSLLLLAAFGPFGALIAMTGFRHKTRQRKFFLVPLFLILHLLLFLFLWPRVAA